MENREKVSVIIRTCGRPQVLKTALDSVRKQTYRELEVIVVEDGKNVSEPMIASEYPDLNIFYKATGAKAGRSAAGNIGLSLATGKYCNFLDDDDMLFPTHVELLLDKLKAQPSAAAYGIAQESQIIKTSEDPYIIKEKRTLVRYRQPFNRLLLYSFNYLPIQSVLFDRTLYTRYGGFDEKLDALEDWDLWVRYSLGGDFLFVPEITSKYYVPYRGKKKSDRGKSLDSALRQVRGKFEGYGYSGTVGELQKEMDYVINVYNQKKLLYYLKQVWNYFVYGDR